MVSLQLFTYFGTNEVERQKFRKPTIVLSMVMYTLSILQNEIKMKNKHADMFAFCNIFPIFHHF